MTVTATEPLPGRIDTLTADQEAMLKETWRQLLTLFKQAGEPWTAPEPKKKEEPKKSSFWGFSGGSAEPEAKDLFMGVGKNPAWLDLPLEKALPLIPGEELELTFWNMTVTDNADAVLLRFLRARKWDQKAAFNMLVNCLRWRLVNRVDEIVALGEQGIFDELEKLKPGMGQQFVENLHCNKAVIGGPSKNGYPIAYINPRFHKKEDQDHEVIKIMTVYFMESSRMVVHQPMEAACILFNMDGFTIANWDFEFIKFLVKCFEAYYPETLGFAIIHKAPWVFSTLWSMVTPILDPVVASKFRFTKNNDELFEYIDESILPDFILGTGKIEKNTVLPPMPTRGVLIEERAQTAEYKEFRAVCQQYMELTSEWCETDTLARDPKRKEQALTVRRTAIRLDSHIRGRTHFHELGLAESANGRLILKFFGKMDDTDITDAV
ncbi:CRAL/TRIO domain-containing protein [Hesseltinella vesiculosa]|uniref:CRAL/TRIO domain-containing protein n=1 Tax=Hesseltinella vesiculosa TaxID=101127 RepID=A0A1X2GUT1_9FUNG|nr:CRAL/TRIO domain-containing protein [Hesseltinella vesiculosa]